MTYKDPRELAKECFNNPAGEAFLKYAVEAHVDNTALRATTNETLYLLGQKELVQEWVSYVNSTNQPTEVITDE